MKKKKKSRFYTGVELFPTDAQTKESCLKSLWHHSDAIMCCALKASDTVFLYLLKQPLYLFMKYFNFGFLL